MDVALGEWYVRTNPEKAAAGPVTFDIRNEGTTVHAFEIEGQGIERRSKNLSPGQSEQLTVDLKAGTYEAYCPIGNHEEQGMRTEFTVE
ncbi:MAG: cupredoxin domain-containing protein [Armatimonadota bacterium]